MDDYGTLFPIKMQQITFRNWIITHKYNDGRHETETADNDGHSDLTSYYFEASQVMKTVLIYSECSENVNKEVFNSALKIANYLRDQTDRF